MRRWFVVLLLAGMARLASAADDWMDVATVSATLGNIAGRVCIGASRTDVGCPAYAPYVGADGSISATRFVGDGSGLFNITGASADRIVSGTTSMLAISNTGYISVTQSGVNTAYFHPSMGLVTVGVSSTGGISGTTGYFAGNVGIGTASPSSTLHVNGGILATGVGSTQQGLLGLRHLASGGSRPMLFFQTSNGGSLGSPTDVVNQQFMGDILFAPYINGAYRSTASIMAYVDGLPTASSFPSRIGFSTTSSGSTVRQERLRITGDGLVAIGLITPTANLEVSGTVSATMAQLSSSPNVACGPGRYGTIKVENGRIYLCRQ